MDDDELPAAYVMHPRRRETTIAAWREGYSNHMTVHIYWSEPEDDRTRPRHHAYIPLSEERRKALIRQLGGRP